MTITVRRAPGRATCIWRRKRMASATESTCRIAGRDAWRRRVCQGAAAAHSQDGECYHPAAAGFKASGSAGATAAACDLAAQVGQHRQHATVIGVGGFKIELAEDVGDMLLDRAVAD